MSTVIATFYNFGISPAAGRVRLITSSGSTPTVVSGSGVNLSNTDPIAFYFNGGSSTGIRVLVVEREYDPVTFDQLPCQVSVYDPSTWGTPTVAATTYTYSDSEDLLNVYSLTSPGGANAGTLFGADYSAGRIFKFVHAKPSTTETLTLASDYYEFAATGSGASAYSVDTVFNTESSVNYIYAVAQQYALSGSSSNPANYTYFNSIIVKLSASNLAASPVDGPDASLAPNVFELQLYDSNLYVTALGGAQWNSTPIVWNEASRIQRVALANLAVTNLVRPSTVAEASANNMFDIRSLAILSDGTAYILTGSYNASFVLSGRLWVTTISDLDSASNILISAVSDSTLVETLTNVSGFLWALLPADDIGLVWGMFGNTLGVYSDSGISGSAISAGTASQWGATGSPSFNAISLAMPSITRRLKAGAAPASIKSVRGFVHPLLASRDGVKPEDFDAFVNSYMPK